jgi:hypothetical protein
MHCARKTVKKGEKQRFSNYGGFKAANMAANGPPLHFWMQNTLKYMKTACLIFLGTKRNLEEFLSEILIFQPRFKGGRGRIS